MVKRMYEMVSKKKSSLLHFPPVSLTSVPFVKMNQNLPLVRRAP